MTEQIKEVSPATIAKAEKLIVLLREAQTLAIELMKNDTLKVLKVKGTELETNLDYQIMQCKFVIQQYKKDIENTPLF